MSIQGSSHGQSLAVGERAFGLQHAAQSSTAVVAFFVLAFVWSWGFGFAATQIKSIPWWDVVDFNGVADLASIGAQSAFAVATCVLGYVYNKRKGNT